MRIFFIIFANNICMNNIYKVRSGGMLRGCQRRIIVLKNTKSDIFEEAYFILSERAASGEAPVSESDMILEANRIISESSQNALRQPRGQQWTALKTVLLIGLSICVTAAAFMLLTPFLYNLFYI